MSSVRDRIEREQRSHQRPEAPAPARPRSPLIGGDHHAASTRERAEARKFEVTPERLQPIDKHRATGLTSYHNNASTSVRQREELKAAQAEIGGGGRSGLTARAQWWLDEHDRLEAEKKQREIEAERLQDERIAKDKAIEASNARALVVGLCFDQFNATPAERKRILALPGAQDASPETLVSQLLEVRKLHAFAESCNDASKAEADARGRKKFNEA